MPVSGMSQIAVTDDLGDVVVVPRPAQRIISLSPHLTEVLFSLGAGNRIVGTSRYSDFPEAARSIPVVGDAFSMNVEAIVASQPDLIIAWSTGGASRALEKLSAMGFPIYVNEAATIESIGDTAAAIAVLLGLGPLGAELKRLHLKKINQLRNRYKGVADKSVFFQISDESLYTVNDGHLIGQAIGICNAENVFGGLQIPVPLVSLESVVVADPDVIVIAKPDDQADSHWQSRWAKFDGFDLRIRWVKPGLVSRPSLRMVEGIEELCRVIHQTGENDGKN